MSVPDGKVIARRIKQMQNGGIAQTQGKCGYAIPGGIGEEQVNVSSGAGVPRSTCGRVVIRRACAAVESDSDTNVARDVPRSGENVHR